MSNHWRDNAGNRRDQEREWVPPKWQASGPARPMRPEPESTVRRKRPQRTVPVGAKTQRTARPRVDEALGPVLAIAIPELTVALLAIVLPRITAIYAPGPFPLASFLIAGIAIVGYLLTRGANAGALPKACLVAAVTVAGFLPLLVIQVTVAREPYTALALGTGLPLLLGALAACLLLGVAAALVVGLSWEFPDEAALLFMPIGLLVPTVIGLSTAASERQALQGLAFVTFISAVATVIAWSQPPARRAFAPPAMLAFIFFALWATGHAPQVPDTSGGIVWMSHILLLVTTVVLVVGLPILAIWVRSGLRMAADGDTELGTGR